MGQPSMAGTTPRSSRWAVLISAGIVFSLLMILVVVVVVPLLDVASN